MITLFLGTIAILAGFFLVWRLGREWPEAERLLLGTFVIGLVGLALTAVLPWPAVGEFVVFAAMGGMVGAAAVWFRRRRGTSAKH